MNYEKLSPALAALVFEYLRFPDATIASVNGTRPQSLSISASNLLQTTVFIYCETEAVIENADGLHINSEKGAIRTARIELEKISDLSELNSVKYLSCSMQLKPLNDFEAIEKQLNEYSEDHSELNGADVIFGIIGSGIDSAQPIFAERLHSIWDQTVEGIIENEKVYGKVLTGESLAECTDGDGYGTKAAQIFIDFAAKFGTENKENIIVVKTDYQNVCIADAVRYIFETAEKLGKKAIINLNLDTYDDSQTIPDDLFNFIEQESSAEKIIAAVVGNNLERNTEKTIVIAPNKFSPAKVNFVIPSNSQPASPSEVVLRGWFEAEGNCELLILSPGGGVTRSTQAEVIAGNPTLFGNYFSSQAFLTKAKIIPSGRREFFIDLRPISPQQFVTGGTWKLTVTNVGNTAVNVKILSWVPKNANNARFI